MAASAFNVAFCITRIAAGLAKGNFGRTHGRGCSGSQTHTCVRQTAFYTCVLDNNVAKNIPGALRLEVDAVPETRSFLGAHEDDRLVRCALGREHTIVTDIQPITLAELKPSPRLDGYRDGI